MLITHEQLESDIRLLIVHPDDRKARRYLSELIANHSLLYSRFPGINLDFDDAEHIVFEQYHCIVNCDTFPDAYVLDECDRVSEEALNDLLPYLIQCDPLTIIMFSRELPFVFLEDDVFSQHIQIVSDTDFFATDEDTASYSLEVSGFGVGRARVNGRDIPFIPGDSVHQLFFYLLENHVLSREEILSQFWSQLDDASAITNFHMTLQRLNNLLGFRLMQLKGSHYRLNPAITLQYDVQVFRDTLQSIMYGNATTNLQAYENAYRLQHHAFLLGTEAGWAKTIRDELRELQSDVCYNLAKLATNPHRALGLYSLAFRYNPYREDIAHAIMTFYLNNALPCDALTVYDLIAGNLMQRFGITPAQNLRELMQQAKAQCNR